MDNSTQLYSTPGRLMERATGLIPVARYASRTRGTTGMNPVARRYISIQPAWSIILVRYGAFVAAAFLFLVPNATAQNRGTPAAPQVLRFEDIGGKSKPPARVGFADGDCQIYRYAGHCSIGADFLVPRYHYTFGTGFDVKTGDLVGLLGRVYRADCRAAYIDLARVPDKDLPKGVKPPQWDSVPVFRTRGTQISSINSVSIKVLEIGDQKDVTASLRIEWIFNEKPRKKKNIILAATVKAGDILLLRDKGHQIRAIVKPDPKSRVIGWLELSPEPIPEANLIRDKKPFVRPVPKEKE